MSKAFTREDDGDNDDQDASDSPSPLPVGAKNYMTPRGEAKLRDEFRELMNVTRPKIVETVAWAASLGDRSENADYIYGKRRLREIDRRIRFLTKRLENAEVIDPEKQNSPAVVFGATVVVRDESDVNRTYCIVGIDETNGKLGKISWISPIGRTLLRHKVGETVTVRTPKGEEDFEIMSINFLPIP